MDKPTVIMILPYLNEAGTERHAAHLVTALRSDLDFVLLSPPGAGRVYFPPELSWRMFSPLDRHPVHGFQEFKKHLQDLRVELAGKPVVVHVHGAPELLLLAHGWLGTIPTLMTIHGFHGRWRMADYHFTAWVCNKYADHVVCVALAEKEILQKKGLSAGKLSLIMNGIPDIDAMKSPVLHGLEQGVPTLGCIARLARPKGLETLIRAAGILASSGRKLQLILVGGGGDEQRLRFIAGEYPGMKTIFTGHVPDAGPYYQLLDIFVLVSVSEAHALAPIEAMRAGKPVIISDVGGARETVAEDETGLIIPPGDVDALKRALLKLLDDQALRDAMGVKGRCRYLELFSSARMAAAVKTIYGELLSRGGS